MVIVGKRFLYEEEVMDQRVMFFDGEFILLFH